MSRFIIVCGGTGGHLSPGISLAEKLIADGHVCELVLSKKEVDSRLIAGYESLEFVRSPGAPFSLNPVKLVNFIIAQIQSLIFGFKIIRRLKPDLVLAFGGYLSLGIAINAWALNVSLALHEANRHPGRATFFLKRFARRIYLPEGVRLGGVESQVIRNYGYPLRKSIRRYPREKARKLLSLPKSGKCLAIIGGSQGAEVLNSWVRDNFSKLGSHGINIYCVTGLGKGQDGVVETRGEDGRVGLVNFTPFTDRMELVLSCADLVISRAGAGSIAEIIACGTPSILIPYPYAADNHQQANALHLEQRGGCIVLDQKRMGDLLGEVEDIIYNDWLLGRLRQNLDDIYVEDTTAKIVADLVKLSETPSKAKPGKIELPA